MLDSFLRLIGLARQEEVRNLRAEAEANVRRIARLEWEAMTPEQKARSAEMVRLMRNSQPSPGHYEQYRAMTEEELARFNAPELIKGQTAI